jgi:hypothetical protein
MQIAHYSCHILIKPEHNLQIFEKSLSTKGMKILPMGTELFQADRHTDVKKLIVAFPNFAKGFI